VTPKLINRMKVVVVVMLAMLMTSCGEFSRQGRSPSQIFIQNLSAASGAAPDEFGGTLSSDVLTLVDRTINGAQVQVPTVFGDLGQVTMVMVLKDQGQPGLSSVPSPINAVTFTRYHVAYRRADGRNTPGVDVPFPFDGATTFTVPHEGSVTVAFELVRLIAKTEAPLAGLVSNFNIISTIGEITFFGHDQAGNELSTTGSIGISFGNFGDPE
jgi:hypothetical protein